jgi:hypothetical protein
MIVGQIVTACLLMADLSGETETDEKCCRFPSLRRLLHYPPNLLHRCPGFQELRACGKRFVVCAVRFIPLLYFTKDLSPDIGCWQVHLAVVDTV